MPTSQSIFTTATHGQAFIVPAAVTSIAIKAWGGAGGCDGDVTAGGGGGGFAGCTVNVSAGETLTIMVGGGGGKGTAHTGGGGGGYSAVLRSTTPLCIAAGGGGAGLIGAGGAGGGVTGIDGTGALKGAKGTAAAGGAAGGGTATAGASLQGGAGGPLVGSVGSTRGAAGSNGGGNGGSYSISLGKGGGGGGGGYFGGGGGGEAAGGGCGGGGGSSYTTGSAVTNTAGSGVNPGNAADGDYGGHAGLGSTSAAGNPGRVVLTWTGGAAAAPTNNWWNLASIASTTTADQTGSAFSTFIYSTRFSSPQAINFYVYTTDAPGTLWVTSTEPAKTGWIQNIEGSPIPTLIVGGVVPNPRSFAEISAFAAGSAGMLGGSPGSYATVGGKLYYSPGGYSVNTDYPTIHKWDGTTDSLVATLTTPGAGVVPKAVVSMLYANNLIYLTTFDSGTTAADYAGRVMSLDPVAGTLTLIGAQFTGGELPYALAWHNNLLWCGTNKGNGTQGNIYYNNGLSAWTSATAGISAPVLWSWAPVPVTGSTTFSYVVTATNSQGETIASNTVTRTDAKPLVGGQYNYLQVEIVTGASGYNVYRLVGGGTTGKVPCSITGSDAYYVYIQDVGNAGDGSSPPGVNGTIPLLGSIDSLYDFGSTLYVGGGNVSGTFAKVSTYNDATGIYTTSLTATGGAAQTNNGFLGFIEYLSNLYAFYWNPDTPAIAKIYKFDGATWSTVYTGATTTIRPYIAALVGADAKLYVLGGGNGLTTCLLTTTNGSAWTNDTTNYIVGTSTAVPILAEVNF